MRTTQKEMENEKIGNYIKNWSGTSRFYILPLSTITSLLSSQVLLHSNIETSCGILEYTLTHLLTVVYFQMDVHMYIRFAKMFYHWYLNPLKVFLNGFRDAAEARSQRRKTTC